MFGVGSGFWSGGSPLVLPPGEPIRGGLAGPVRPVGPTLVPDLS